MSTGRVHRVTSKKKSDAAQRATSIVYDRAKKQGIPLRGLYPATLKRIKELVEATGDVDQVTLVALRILELDGEGFVAHRSLSWGTYEYVREQLEVPDGGWALALWIEIGNLDEKTWDSADYWLRAWRDAEVYGRLSDAYEARKALGHIRDVVEGT